MTQEEKARAYDEALKDMRVIYPNLKGDAKLAVEHAFPELAESEDEKIRMELKEAFGAYDIESKWNGIPIRSIFAWLEKQKEQKPVGWKPSEEQMTALLWCIAHLAGADRRVLAELYEHLKMYCK